MKPEEFNEELKLSTREIIIAGPARPPGVDLSYPSLPNILKLIKD
jgi:hypothetical protein